MNNHRRDTRRYNGIKFNTKKYYTEDEFLKDGGILDQRIEKLLDNWDDTPYEVALEKAKKSVIEMLEDKYMNLEMEIDNCQGAMSNLNVAFAELDIYRSLVRKLGGNIDSHKKELVDKWFKKQNTNKSTNKVEQLPKVHLDKNINSIGELDVLMANICNAVEVIGDKVNEIIKNLK